MVKLQFGENPKCSNKDYHADTEWLNSSRLKALFRGWENYRETFLSPQKPKKKSTQDNLDFGTLLHSLLLEPENTLKDFAIYEGAVRRGKRFERFKSAHNNKIIVTRRVFQRANRIIRRYRKRKSYKKHFKIGKAEVTVCAYINGCKVKARYDWLDVKRGRIIDLKSSRFEREDLQYFYDGDRRVWWYFLSAALYLQIAEAVYRKPFEFIILGISKKSGKHFYHIYSKYLSFGNRSQLIEGDRRISVAIENYKKQTNK
ncbi:MAG: PD-(D/E)XK nuclease-like domain-containing protein [Bdellovibrionales bacterium]|nr:PD-(D/E)XK nuclease-like domain-containing protein [Bdellovibrionales bacterium]